ncbi:MAG: hypothetical protein FVQ82_16095 [Planctomycetes bacterium]|nr:hypothetical protein [Planctomycetota bacterium]
MSSDTALKRVFILFAGIWLVLLFGGEAEGIILHPDNEPNLLTWTERPGNNVVGRWDNTASCVAVGPNYIITTTHQPNDGINSIVNIGGDDYSINEIFNHPTADLRLAVLNDANLAEYASINFDPNEVNQVAVIGGFGAARGDTLFVVEDVGGGTTIEHPYGYQWLYPTLPTPPNGARGWGTNKVVSTASSSSELIISQFDPNSTTVSTDYECTLAEHDSGGGWFLPDAGGAWKVIGLSRGVAFNGESWFMHTDLTSIPQTISQYPNPMDGHPIKANHLDAVRISSYAGWIIGSMHTFELQNLAGQWLSTGCDEMNNYCNYADIFRDGVVNLKDFSVLAANWLNPPD